MEESRNDVLNHVIFLGRHFRKDNPQPLASTILMELRIPTRRNGFDHLVHAIVICTLSLSSINLGEIYHKIDSLKPYKTMDGAISKAIEAGWNASDKRKWNIYFPADEGWEDKKPTNQDFISRISHILKLWQDTKEEASYERI